MHNTMVRPLLQVSIFNLNIRLLGFISLMNMEATLNVEYAICHPEFIESSAVALANTIFLQKEPVEKVLARINAAAVRQIDYTRTISLVVQKMLQNLRQMDSRLGSYVKDDVLDLAVSTYINYWKDVLFATLSDTPHCDVGNDDHDDSYFGLDAISPLAVAAYLGDLYTLGYLSTEMFMTCVAFMVNNFRSVFHLRCIEVILERANSSPVPRLAPPYLFECLGTIRRRAHQLLGKEISNEEDSLTRLLYRLLFNVNDAKGRCDRWDPRLSESRAEVMNVCGPVSNHDIGDKVYDHPWSGPMSALNLAAFPVRSATDIRERVIYEHPAYDDECWDAIYASPDPEDLPPPESFC